MIPKMFLSRLYPPAPMTLCNKSTKLTNSQPDWPHGQNFPRAIYWVLPFSQKIFHHIPKFFWFPHLKCWDIKLTLLFKEKHFEVCHIIQCIIENHLKPCRFTRKIWTLYQRLLSKVTARKCRTRNKHGQIQHIGSRKQANQAIHTLIFVCGKKSKKDFLNWYQKNDFLFHQLHLQSSCSEKWSFICRFLLWIIWFIPISYSLEGYMNPLFKPFPLFGIPPFF